MSASDGEKARQDVRSQLEGEYREKINALEGEASDLRRKLDESTALANRVSAQLQTASHDLSAAKSQISELQSAVKEKETEAEDLLLLLETNSEKIKLMKDSLRKLGQQVSDDEDDEEDDDREPFIRISPVVAVLNGELTMVPYSAPPAPASPLNINAINGLIEVAQVKTADFSDQDTLVKAQTITFDVSAEPENAGTLVVDGVIQQPEVDEENDAAAAIAVNLAVQAQSLDLGILSPVLLASLPQDLPFDVTSGLLNGNLEVSIAPETEPSLTGTASLRDGAIAFDALTTPFTDINTQAQFRDNGVRLDEITADFGEMSAVAAGTIDARNGYDLTGEIFPVALADIAAAFDFEPPIPAEGILKAEAVEITGPLAQPLIAGNILSTDVVTLDKVQFANMATRLSYSAAGLAFANLSLEPLAGGSLTGEGALSFGRPATLALQLTGQDLPADAIGQAYGLPDTVVIGPVDRKSTRLNSSHVRTSRMPSSA